MIRLAKLALLPVIAALSACVMPLNHATEGKAPALSQAPDAPELALLHYRLLRYADAVEGTLPTICAGLGQGQSAVPLPQEDEVALIEALPFVAPHDRCQLQGDNYVDAITGGAAVMMDVHDLTCEQPGNCTAWSGYYASPTYNGWSYYRLRFEGGKWNIAREDLGIVLTSDPAVPSDLKSDALEALYRHQFTHNASGGQQSVAAYCLEFENGDPSENFLNRFAGEQPRIVVRSDCEAGVDGTFLAGTRQPAIVHRVDKIECSDAICTATGGYYEGGESASGNSYRLERQNGRWVVIEDRMNWIS